ncbi:MAG: alpha/beta hydrolase [Clostridium sp.]|jgi:pimeloyl-ACP methyl ester carboxylesterase|uniref:alpha/beta hydrolase n=1 Tax=Clostridium sp. TaxID=1506 RepID=UPI0025BD5D94|nr:alpha/beta hydrolase [Clostridium sp.]MCH3963504.1 alpha/beta hydrolase [Clostridium sp.]MCI1714645.1 alpha/beta hydrolase [Clostridium sp.]MCI1799166.1 alpha/beta hydrolase [Clostridium sp.]MCI1812828.1 alpha/beta hydrolase [Clostridium sp.]MCI1869718.1 alpha/beta hydrolase [Clostridium sp.]
MKIKIINLKIGITEFYFEKSTQNFIKGEILLVHGANHGAWCWKNFMNRFSEEGYNVYALNLFNHGRSEKKKFITMSMYKEQLNEFIQAMKINPIIIAHSTGGMIAQMLIDAYPDIYKYCILMSSVSPNGMKNDFKITKMCYFKETIRLVMFNYKLSKQFPYKLFFYSDIGKNFMELYIPEPILICFETFEKFCYKRKKRIMIIGSKLDKIISYKTCIKTSQYYDSECIILNHIGHDMMLDRGWEYVAEKIISYLEHISEESYPKSN